MLRRKLHVLRPLPLLAESPAPKPRPRKRARSAAALALIAPHLVAVLLANELAGWLDPHVSAWTSQWTDLAGELPPLVTRLLTSRFGLLTTAPLLVAWTVPTVVLHTTVQALFAEAGLLARMAMLAGPLAAPFGLRGEDLVRVTMGFGCNVPAVLSTKKCHDCSGDACIAAISFGAACSYQLGATLSVFAGAHSAWLAPVYLAYLVATTMVYVGLTSKGPVHIEPSSPLPALHRPDPRRVAAAVRGTLLQFAAQALPIFALFSVLAAVLDTTGMFDVLAAWLDPALRLLGLPGSAAMALVMASVRKDGILLLGTASLSPGQLLVATYFASTLTPCLVTASAVRRARGLRHTARLLRAQAAAALAFTVLLAALVAALE